MLLFLRWSFKNLVYLHILLENCIHLRVNPSFTVFHHHPCHSLPVSLQDKGEESLLGIWIIRFASLYPKHVGYVPWVTDHARTYQAHRTEKRVFAWRIFAAERVPLARWSIQICLNRTFSFSLDFQFCATDFCHRSFGQYFLYFCVQNEKVARLEIDKEKKALIRGSI